MLQLFQADIRFVWNNTMLRELAQQEELAQYCLPIMLGFVEVRPCSVKGHAFQYILISRRSCFRAGTRYYMRGVDSEGHAANFVETEQIVEYGNTRSSFVQVGRGTFATAFIHFMFFLSDSWISALVLVSVSKLEI
jgi:hypothetical protein